MNEMGLKSTKSTFLSVEKKIEFRKCFSMALMFTFDRPFIKIVFPGTYTDFLNCKTFSIIKQYPYKRYQCLKVQ